MADLTLEDINEIVYPDYFRPCQWRVLKLRILGYTFSEIAQELHISDSTAYSRMCEIRDILGLVGGNKRRNKEIIQWAIDNELISVHF